MCVCVCVRVCVCVSQEFVVEDHELYDGLTFDSVDAKVLTHEGTYDTYRLLAWQGPPVGPRAAEPRAQYCYLVSAQATLTTQVHDT